MTHQINFSRKVALLLAQGFTENAYRATLRYFAENNMEVLVIGLSKEIIVGEDGLKVKPNYLISHLETICDRELGPTGVVIGGGINCINLLASDPRVSHWLSWFSSEGYVGALRPLDYAMLIQLSQANLANLMIQNDTSYEVFLDEYKNQLRTVFNN